MSTKLLHFIVFSLVGLAVFLTGYLFSRNSDNFNQQALIDNSLVTRFNKTDEKYVAPTGLFELTSKESSFPKVSTSGELWYYIPENGEIRSITIKNPTIGTTLLTKIGPNANYISWADNKTLIAKFPTGAIFYNISSNTSKKYDPLITNPVLNKSGTKIAYSYFNKETGEGNISLADPNLESYKNILPTRFANWQIKWLDDIRLAITKPPTLENATSSIYILDTETGSLKNILEFKNSLEIAWANTGESLIYSYADDSDKETSLFYFDLISKNQQEIFSKALASACTWSINNKIVYCAEPDSFISIDTSITEPLLKKLTGSVPVEVTKNATNLLLNSTEDYLIFKNSKTGKLYGLQLEN
ncbi:MAG: hypothetical protein AAB784_02065 [Patescibacteria group bacterium]